MSAGKYDITIEQGSDFSLQLTVQDGGVAKNLTGYSVRGQMRATVDASTIAASFTGAISNATGGVIIVSLPYTTTDDISPGMYLYDIELYTASSVQKLIKGSATVLGELTK
ncbi:MAG: hypothetical protein ACKVJK_03285 [Methylophagaceae bacterium]|jgi:hypothetical protein|tara:strand:+ start:280 stop:612 length:333 start_codon:yes stop_codon:yes gene_type:complete